MWVLFDYIVGLFMFLWNSLTLWLSNIFILPFSNTQILRLLIPIYIALILAELYQEKHGTSRGNAIQNSVVALWGGIDFLFQALDDPSNTLKLLIAGIIIAYGITILILGVLDKAIIKLIGKIRAVSYTVIIAAPIYYTNAEITATYVTGAILFFYIFDRTFEIIDKFTPDPKALLDDIKEASSVNLLADNKHKPA